MNYYTLQKINNIINLSPYSNDNESTPYISQTLINYYYELKTEILNLCNYDYEYYSEISRIINPCGYIFYKVPGSRYSVSKLKPKSIMFYDLYEIFQTINILEPLNFDLMSSLIIGENYEDSLECLEMLRENYNNDKFFCFYEYNSQMYNFIDKKNFNFIIYEIKNNQNVNNYVLVLIDILLIIINNLKESGNVIIKLDNIFYKQIIEIIYIFSSLFEKVYVVKPNTSDITTFDKYLILQNLNIKKDRNELIQNYTIILNMFINNYNKTNEYEVVLNSNVQSIIGNEIPYFYINKIDDINIIIGQQQLESMNQIINILKNKNKDDKLELYKKNNIQKSVSWCEKFKIPCNKFSDKINIFLPIDKNINSNENNENNENNDKNEINKINENVNIQIAD